MRTQQMLFHFINAIRIYTIGVKSLSPSGELDIYAFYYKFLRAIIYCICVCVCKQNGNVPDTIKTMTAVQNEWESMFDETNATSKQHRRQQGIQY